MYLVSPGMSCQVQHMFCRLDDEPTSTIHVTIAPGQKKAFCEQTGRDALQEARACVLSCPGVLGAEVHNRAVRIVVQRLETWQNDHSHHLFLSLRRVSQTIQDRLAWWRRRATEPVVPSLQQMLLTRLGDGDFRLRSCVAHAGRHGAEATWEMLRLADEWSS